ncbi:hypothetical protein I7I51_05569 [Histoplasma capsulatum]|uniref:Uncharacterized protein n=1 Tax=Ajellomyces capsulatus TaxID=5037 RepID=A0A8A1M2Q3_AJECA|nr:hypothetical protein I7I51_05569 [Histoplasma capsulatum]
MTRASLLSACHDLKKTLRVEFVQLGDCGKLIGFQHGEDVFRFRYRDASGTKHHLTPSERIGAGNKSNVFSPRNSLQTGAVKGFEEFKLKYLYRHQVLEFYLLIKEATVECILQFSGLQKVSHLWVTIQHSNILLSRRLYYILRFSTLMKTPKADSVNYQWLRMKDQNIPTTAKAEASTWIEFRPSFLYLLVPQLSLECQHMLPAARFTTLPGLMDWGDKKPRPRPLFPQISSSDLANPAIRSLPVPRSKIAAKFPNQGKIPLLSFSVPKISAIHCRFPTSPTSRSTSRTAVDRPWPGLAWPDHPFTHPPTHTGEDRVACAYNVWPESRWERVWGVLPEGCSHGQSDHQA